ncbi:hypothetical protein V6N12_058573 [Hibiscus sabdariffa]|uniref:Uncharacterized protein n=1 Tax=Hibiscus sabdariffa TaxID=183260 RepID=A0ABR2ESJ6_9ROSI
MEQARLDCYSFQDQLSMFHLLLCKCFDKLLKQDDKGDVSNRDNGSCPGRYLGCGKAITSSLPLSQEYFPHKANCCCIFLAAETPLLPIPRRRLLSVEACTPSRLCVLGLRIGSVDRLGPWFDALLVQWCLEKYADHIALPVVFSLLAEVGVSAGA